MNFRFENTWEDFNFLTKSDSAALVDTNWLILGLYWLSTKYHIQAIRKLKMIDEVIEIIHSSELLSRVAVRRSNVPSMANSQLFVVFYWLSRARC